MQKKHILNNETKKYIISPLLDVLGDFLLYFPGDDFGA
jgi:hypothetical protein